VFCVVVCVVVCVVGCVVDTVGRAGSQHVRCVVVCAAGCVPACAAGCVVLAALALPALAVGVASVGGRRCQRWRSALPALAVGVASVGGRRCQRWRSAVGGVAAVAAVACWAWVGSPVQAGLAGVAGSRGGSAWGVGRRKGPSTERRATRERPTKGDAKARSHGQGAQATRAERRPEHRAAGKEEATDEGRREGAQPRPGGEDAARGSAGPSTERRARRKRPTKGDATARRHGKAKGGPERSEPAAAKRGGPGPARRPQTSRAPSGDRGGSDRRSQTRRRAGTSGHEQGGKTPAGASTERRPRRERPTQPDATARRAKWSEAAPRPRPGRAPSGDRGGSDRGSQTRRRAGPAAPPDPPGRPAAAPASPASPGTASPAAPPLKKPKNQAFFLRV